MNRLLFVRQSPTMPIPPGPVYLAQTIPKYLASPAVLYVVYYVAKKYGFVDLFIPTWLKIISLALSVPLTLVVRRCLSEFLQAREARARLIERIQKSQLDTSLSGLANSAVTNTGI